MKTLFLALISGMVLAGCATAQKLPEFVSAYQANLPIQNCTASTYYDFEMGVGISIYTETAMPTEI